MTIDEFKEAIQIVADDLDFEGVGSIKEITHKTESDKRRRIVAAAVAAIAVTVLSAVISPIIYKQTGNGGAGGGIDVIIFIPYGSGRANIGIGLSRCSGEINKVYNVYASARTSIPGLFVYDRGYHCG